MEDITEALWGTRVSPSAVSELNQKLYERIEAWRNQPITGRFAYVALDGIWLKRSWGGEVRERGFACFASLGVRLTSDKCLGLVERGYQGGRRELAPVVEA